MTDIKISKGNRIPLEDHIKLAKFLSEGKTYDEISKELHISVSTVKNRLQALRRELGISELGKKGRKPLLREAYKVGWLNDLSNER